MALLDHYVTPSEVRAFNGVRPDDFGLAGDAELDELLAGWARQVRDLIDRAARRDFATEAGDGAALDAVPGAVRSVALRAMNNYVALAQSARDSAFVRIDEWRVGVEQHDMVLTPALRRDLPGPRGKAALGRFGGRVVHGAAD